MNTVNLALCQKRAKDWSSAAESTHNQSVKQAMLKLVTEYRQLLVKFWNGELSQSEANLKRLATLERELDDLNEVVRLVTADKIGCGTDRA